MARRGRGYRVSWVVTLGASWGSPRKVPSCFQQEEWRSNHFWNSPEHSVLNKGTISSEPNPLGFSWASQPRERKYPTPAPPAFPVGEGEYQPRSSRCPDSLNREGWGDWEALWGCSQGHPLTRDCGWCHYRTKEHCPLPLLNPHRLSACLPQFLPSTSGPASNKKSQGIEKAENTLKRYISH